MAASGVWSVDTGTWPAPGRDPRRGTSAFGAAGYLHGDLVTDAVNDYIAGLASAVALLRRSPEPGEEQKDALRALVALAAARSATIRWYDGELTVDCEIIATSEPRMAALAECLDAHNIAEIAVARGAGPDELLALVLGLAATAGEGRVKERLRDAGSVRVMVVLQQYDREPRSVSEAFERVKFDDKVLAEWNTFVEQGVLSEAERVAIAPGEVAPPAPPATTAHEAPPAKPSRPTAPPALPAIPPPRDSRATPRRKSVLETAPTAEGWMAAFERAIEMRFPDHFGDADWACLLDREAGTVRAGDRAGRTSVSVTLPAGYLEQSSWLLAGKMLVELRRLAEQRGAVRPRRV